MERNKPEILKAVMERYGGLINLRAAMIEDEDVVVVNLCEDLNNEYLDEEILEYIIKIIG
jgi:hypothetical protein